jgi:photosystem II stability/assembly factor-like uncharacterized protein
MKTILGLSTIGLSTAATWTSPGDVASACTGVGASSDTTAFVAAGANGAGAEILKTVDDGKTFNSIAPSGSAFLLLDAGSNSATSAVINGLFGAQYTSDGKTFQSSKGGGGQGQSVEGFGKNSYGIAGAFGGPSGVAVSTDAGATFTSFPVSATALDSQHPARYAAYPSETTWYVSAGEWPQNSKSMSDEKSLLIKHLNERVQLRQDRATGDMFYHMLELDELASPNNATQYTGAIAKTTDGGKTWENVFQQDGSFYFNGIHCHDEEHCIAVAEGHNCANPGAHIFITHDGGAHWNQTLFDSGGGAGLMGARMTSATEGWAAGGLGSSLSFEGRFWHTMDAGNTWTKEPLKGMLAMGLDCSDAGHCFAPGITVDRQGTVARYA